MESNQVKEGTSNIASGYNINPTMTKSSQVKEGITEPGCNVNPTVTTMDQDAIDLGGLDLIDILHDVASLHDSPIHIVKKTQMKLFISKI